MENKVVEEYLRLQQLRLEAEVAAVFADAIPDVSVIIYRVRLSEYLHENIFPLKTSNSTYPALLRNTLWSEKHAFNFPGPFYTGLSDSCGTGHIEAPNNVLYAEYFEEFVFKQPNNLLELFGVINAAAVEVLDSYSCDGNEFWTVSRCREWWRLRFDFIADLDRSETRKINGSRARLFQDYLASEAKQDLKRYCFFLDNGFYPLTDNTSLPELK